MALSQKLIDRYCELKKQVPDCLLLMQVGTFFQITNEDARFVELLRQGVAGGFPLQVRAV